MNDATPTKDVTKRAMDAVGKDDPGSDWVLRPEEHAASLPTEAGALKRVLEHPEHKNTMNDYRTNDGAAQWAQRRYKRASAIALGAALGATLIGAILLLFPAGNLPPSIRLTGAAAEYLLLTVAFLAAQYNAFWHPFGDWMKARGRAELLRIKLFNDVMKGEEAARPDELPLLPLKLEYFRRYQFEVQSRFYDGRGHQHKRSARRIRILQLVSFGLAGTAGLIGLLESMSLLNLDGLRPIASWHQAINQVATYLKIDDQRGLVALGVVASAIYGFAAALSLMALHERNATRYFNTHDNLSVLSEKELGPARRAAAENKPEHVQRFIDSAQALISSEHQEWVRWREWAPAPDVRAVYIVVPKVA